MSDLPLISIQNTEPPCPRVNTWASGYPVTEFLTTSGSFTFSQPRDAEFSGIDIFFWNSNSTEFRPQTCTFTATGNYEFFEELAGENLDQTKYQIRYSEPGDYIINISIQNT